MGVRVGLDGVPRCRDTVGWMSLVCYSFRKFQVTTDA
jgi:hypothetical protein